jgi:NADH-quinone oxidoreductase subunit C
MLEPQPHSELSAGAERFELVYELQSLAHKSRLRVKARLADTGSEDRLPVVDSIHDIYLAADWHERECYDLFGIHFRGHPDLRRILLPDRWDGHPLRKDYPFDGKRVWKVGTTVVDGVWADDYLGPVGGAGE